MKTDRRTKRTEKAIQGAFLQLYFKKELNKITVKELCELADINKSTFYLHYHDIYDLAEQFRKNLVEQLYAIVAEYEIAELLPKAPEIWNRILCLYAGYGSEEVALNRLPFEMMQNVFGSRLSETILGRLSAADPTEDTRVLSRRKLLVDFIISGFLGLLSAYDTGELIDCHALEQISDALRNGIRME